MSTGISVFPFHDFRCLVVLADVAHEFLLQISDGSEHAARDHVALDFAEP